MHSVAIELTAFCNQKCDYCYNAWRDDGGRSVETGDTETLLARVERLLDAFDLDHVTLTGGEPLAHPGLFALLDRLTERRVPAQIISNGGLVTEEIAERLARYKLRFIQVTLNGPDAELHEAHVGRGHFEKTVRGVKALLARGIAVVGCIVVTRKNAERVGEILSLWCSLGVRHIALSRFSPAGYAASYAAELLPSRTDLLTAFDQAEPFGRDHGMTLNCTMPVPPCAVEIERFASIRFGYCPIGTSMQELALGPDGRLRNCTLHGKPIDPNDVLDPMLDLAGVLNSPAVAGYRRELPEFCHGCLHAETCGGGCGAAADWVLGHARRFPDPLVFQHVDDDFAARLKQQRRDGRTHLEVIL